MLLNDTGGGNVGIGTNNPTYPLDVSGNINFTGNLYQNGNLFSGGSDDSSVWSTNETNVYYNSGNVGIGTTSPSNLLTLKTGTNDDGYILKNEDNYLLFKMTRDSTKLNSSLAIYDGTSSQNTVVKLSNNSDSYFNGGNVGIGTITPSQKLDVNGNIKVTGDIVAYDASFNSLKVNGVTIDTNGGGSSSTSQIITKKGQILEVLLGRAESGETVTVDTGSYTFTQNTNFDNTKLNTTFQKVEPSELTYTAPSGTERIFYEFRMRGGYDNPTGVVLFYQLFIEDLLLVIKNK